MQCQHVIAKTGKQCRGGAMRGQTLCGPHTDALSAPVQTTKGVDSLKKKPKNTKPTKGLKVPCPECGLHVHVTGTLISYHKNINGCDADEMPS